jgi:hypothetical protein
MQRRRGLGALQALLLLAAAAAGAQDVPEFSPAQQRTAWYSLFSAVNPVPQLRDGGAVSPIQSQLPVPAAGARTSQLDPAGSWGNASGWAWALQPNAPKSLDVLGLNRIRDMPGAWASGPGLLRGLPGSWPAIV